jgi:TusA-related sulfurtransferase
MPQTDNCREIDLRGQICPSTLLSALKEINACKTEITAGAISLLFLTDNRSSTTHISEMAFTMGYRVDVKKDQGYYRILISGNS